MCLSLWSCGQGDVGPGSEYEVSVEMVQEKTAMGKKQLIGMATIGKSTVLARAGCFAALVWENGGEADTEWHQLTTDQLVRVEA